MNPDLANAIRSRLGGQTDKDKEEQALVAKATRIFDDLYKGRRKAEYEWWINDQFYNGQQYTLFNRTASKVERTAPQNDAKITINLIKKNARFVVMWLNRDHPQAKIKPGSNDDDVYVRVKVLSHAHDYWYQKNQLNKKYKQTTLDAYKYKVGVMKIMWDNEAIAPTSPYTDPTSGKRSTTSYGEIVVERVDPFEMYWDPLASDADSCRFICHAVPRTIGEIKSNPNYINKDKVSADGKLAASFLKAGEIRSLTNGALNQSTGGGGDFDTVIVREMYWRELIDGAWKIRMVVTTSNGTLLRNQVWPMNFYPFEFYLADVQGTPLDGGSPIRDLRSPQRAYNKFMGLVQNNGELMAKINWKMPRNANINVITDEAGQFIEFDPTPGGSPEQITPASMPSYVENFLTRLRNDLDDLGGNHSASYGQSPGSKASGELVNRLQEGDSNNLLLMRDNLDDFMARVTRKQLLTFKYNAKVDRQIPSKDSNAMGQYDFVKLTPDMVSEDDEVVITSGTNMPYSQGDRQDFLLNMKSEGILTNDQFIKALQNTDLDAATKNDDADIERALKENRDLMAGKTLPQPAKQEDHSTHLRIHTQLVKSEQFLTASDKVKNNIEAHINDHVSTNYVLTQISNSLNVEPIKRSETVNYRPSNLLEMTPAERTQMFSKFGIQSDVAEIIARGGLNIQDPETAEQQAQAEDNDMLDGKPRSVGIGDNHQVHIETHTQMMQTPAWELLPEVIKTLITSHVQDHITGLQSMNPTPGLELRPNYDVPSNTQVFVNHQPTTGKPVNQAAVNPKDPTQRPFMQHELLQHKDAVKNQLSTEAMAAKQQQQEEAAAASAKAQPPAAKKPKAKKKA